MGLQEITGSQLMDGTEITVIDDSGLNQYEAVVYIDPLANGSPNDHLIIRHYVKDAKSGTMKLEKTYTYDGAYTEVVVRIPFVPTSEYKITLQQTLGTNRTFNWAEYKY